MFSYEMFVIMIGLTMIFLILLILHHLATEKIIMNNSIQEKEIQKSIENEYSKSNVSPTYNTHSEKSKANRKMRVANSSFEIHPSQIKQKFNSIDNGHKYKDDSNEFQNGESENSVGTLIKKKKQIYPLKKNALRKFNIDIPTNIKTESKKKRISE